MRVVVEKTLSGVPTERLVPETDEDVALLEQMIVEGQAQWAPGFSDQPKWTEDKDGAPESA